MKKVLLIIVVFLVFISGVSAAGIEQKVETPLYKLSDEVFEVSRQRNYFTDDGFITVDFDKDYSSNYVYNASYLFTRYDNKGNVLKESKLDFSIESSVSDGMYAIDYYNDSLYLFVNGTYENVRGYHLFVIEEDLNITLKKTYTLEELILDETETEDYVVTVENLNIVNDKLAVLVQKFNFWSMKSEESINLFDMNTLESEIIEVNDENRKNYFYEDYLKNYYGDVSYVSYDNEYNFVSYKTGNFARLDVYKDNQVVLAINESKYTNFSDVKVIGNYFVMIANYSSTEVNPANDVLIYTNNGKLVKTITSNANYHSLVVKDNQFLVGRYYEDGECTIAKGHHNTKQNCISYVQHILYEMETDSNVEDKVEEENPDTSSVSIICGVILIIGVGIIGFNSYKKVKNFK